VRESLHELTGAVACNWETAGVFVAALRSRLPPMSLRVVTDLGDENSLRDLKRNARRHLQELYRFVRTGLEAGWFVDLHGEWRELPDNAIDRLPPSVLSGG
jgi:nucleoside phosphorylase